MSLHISECKQINSHCSQTTEDQVHPPQSVTENKCELRKEVKDIIKNFDSVFSKDKYDVGALRVEPQRIVFNSDLPVSLRPYRTSPVEEQEIKSQVEKLLQAGLIKESNSPYSFPVTLTFKRDEDDGNVSRCYSTGRPRVTKPNEDRHLAVTSKRNRRSTASDLYRQLSSPTGTTVSRQTVHRRLGHIGLYARRPVRCVPLTATHCRLRLAWSREHALWTPQQWSCVMFSDESRFSLQSDSRRTLIWRAPGTRYHQENTIERHRYGGAGWLVWGGIILGSRTDLHVQSVTMTGHIYRDVILEQHVRLFGAPWVLNFCLWMTTPFLTVQTL
ncbi:Transposable element Tcb1 transposase [Araneus ventricosus]|uniref:Transposable element Tcb1 transposase n=1 Tax=Araneus ventricosus TaxID=182803 RepID=A0A4Y2JDM3_ARAVE|nr:Transposable element Tcb1 transposase [Araneus ventricosus]